MDAKDYSVAVIPIVAYLVWKSISSFIRHKKGIPPARFLHKKYATIHGRRMAYVEVGKGNPIVFFHGNPASSFLWRNVMPYLESHGRLIALDMIGMGDSEKLPPLDPARYSLDQHMKFLYGLLEHLGVKENVTVVVHDWGSVFGLQWAYSNRENPNAVKGIVMVEPLLQGFTSTDPVASSVQFMKSPAGQEKLLMENMMVEEFIPTFVLRKLTDWEMNGYRRPFKDAGERRKAMANFPVLAPLQGDPAAVDKVMKTVKDWVSKSTVKKLFFNPTPGALTPAIAGDVKSWPNVTEVQCKGTHFVQEDEPEVIGEGIAKWL